MGHMEKYFFGACLLFVSSFISCCVSQKVCPLNFYDANNKTNLETIRNWWNMVKEPLTSNNPVGTLMYEAKTMYDKTNYKLFEKYKNKYKKTDADGLTVAEQLAVFMYTTKFNQEYNDASRSKR